MTTPIDLTGKQYGLWSVLDGPHRIPGKDKTYRAWRCRCECGTERIIRSSNLSSGQTNSCGCKRLEYNATGDANRKHSLGGTRAFNVWKKMLNRCTKPDDSAYPNYGGRGITVCDRWHDVENFVADMGQPPKGLTLERVDNDGGYNPENCKWATRSEQARNKRNTKITWDKVAEARMMYENGIPTTKIAEVFGYSVGGMCNIVNNRTWQIPA